MKKKILVTSALPYANGSIHIGHLVEYIQTDIFVRSLRQMGEDVIYCCADDTHGTPIEVNAYKQGITPEELVRRSHIEHIEDFDSYDIVFDSYYSTNSEENKRYSDLIFTRLKEKGLIYTKDVENFYDEKENRFLPDRFVKGKCPKCLSEDQYGDVCEKCNATYKPTDLIDPYSVLSKEKPIRKTSKHYFFKLSALSEKLDNWLTNNKNLQPEIVNYVKNWIKNGLDDWDISRDGPYFGFKIPGEENKYYYVWLDAPIGYISSTENYCRNIKKGAFSTEDYWNPTSDSRIIHFIGKDIIYFHLLFWPAMLMEADFKLPENIVVHGFLTVNKEKMSKSRGTFIKARQFLEISDPSYLRYYYAGNLTSKAQDIDLDFSDFKERINTELVGNIGNFVYRVLSFLERYFDSKVIESYPYDEELMSKFNLVLKRYETREFREAVKTILEIGSYGNRYMQENEPWKLIKTDKEKAHMVLSFSARLAKDLAIVLSPIIPSYSSRLLSQLQADSQDSHRFSFSDIGKDIIEGIGKPEIIFNKVEDILLSDPFSRVDLRVAKIESVKKHPLADRLYVLSIDIGSEKRQLVAGLREHYKEEELLGRRIIVVSNLKPANLKGEKSQGMLLAASKDGKLELVSPKKSSPGERVFSEGLPHPDGLPIITIEQFFKAPLTTKAGKLVYEGNVLKTQSEEISVDIGDGAIVK